MGGPSSLVFDIVGESYVVINYRPVSIFSVVGKTFEKHVNNKLLDQLEKCYLLISSMVSSLLSILRTF